MTAIPRGLTNTIGPLLASAALLTAGCLYVRFGSANLVRLASPDMGLHVDFESFWRSAYALRHHADLYRTGAALPNLNPPVLAVLLAPLAELGVLTAYHVFALFGTVLVVGSVIAVAEWTRLRSVWAMVTVAALLLSSPLQGTAALGQVYGLLAVALTAAWLAERRGRQGWSGVAIGLAVALKPSLAPLLLWPVVRRRWPALGGGCPTPRSGRRALDPGRPALDPGWRALGAALAAGAVAAAVGIVAGSWAATVEWLRLLGAFQVTGFLDNDSLAALAVRFHQPAWLGFLAAGGLLGITLWRARRRPEHALWSITAAALLLAPVAWNNYLVLLAPAVPLLLARHRWRAALPLLALPVIGIEWALALPPGDSVLSRLGMSLYCGILLTYWAVLTFGPAEIEPESEVELDAPDVSLDAVRERVST